MKKELVINWTEEMSNYELDMIHQHKVNTDLITSIVNNATKEMNLQLISTKTTREGIRHSLFTFTFKYVDSIKIIEIKVSRHLNTFNIMYRVYSWDNFLRERTFKCSTNTELKNSIYQVIRQDLYLEK